MTLKRLVRRARQLQEYTLDLMLVGVRRQSSKLWSSYDICAGADKKALFQSQLHAMRHCHLYIDGSAALRVQSSTLSSCSGDVSDTQ